MSQNDCGTLDDPRPIDQLYLLHSTEYARHVLDYFRNSSEQEVSLAELVDDVARRRTDSEPPDPETVAAQLHHATLPKLAEADIVEYDWHQRTVRYRSQPSVDAHLDVAAETED